MVIGGTAPRFFLFYLFFGVLFIGADTRKSIKITIEMSFLIVRRVRFYSAMRQSAIAAVIFPATVFGETVPREGSSIGPLLVWSWRDNSLRCFESIVSDRDLMTVD